MPAKDFLVNVLAHLVFLPIFVITTPMLWACNLWKDASCSSLLCLLLEHGFFLSVKWDVPLISFLLKSNTSLLTFSSKISIISNLVLCLDKKIFLLLTSLHQFNCRCCAFRFCNSCIGRSGWLKASMLLFLNASFSDKKSIAISITCKIEHK